MGASPDGAHYSAIAFNSEPRIKFRFNSLQQPQYTRDNVKRLIDEMQFTRGTTRIDKALDLADRVLFSEKSGMRPGVPQVSRHLQLVNKLILIFMFCKSHFLRGNLDGTCLVACRLPYSNSELYYVLVSTFDCVLERKIVKTGSLWDRFYMSLVL